MENGHNKAEPLLSTKVTVQTDYGLHARPAARLAEMAAKFSSTITLMADEKEVDAKSILDILTLAAPKGTQMSIQAKGEDAKAALDTLSQLFTRDFEV